MSTAIALKSGSQLAPIYPQSIEDVYRLAKMALTSGMLKPQKTGYGDAAVHEDANAVLARGTMIIMQGMELGIPPMQSLQLLAMINGRIVAHSEAVPGILLAKGFKIKETWSGTPMHDDWTCTIELTRPNGATNTASFSVADAKQARLWDQAPTKTSYGKTKPNDSAWFCYPKRLLKARALGFAGKDGGADALKGIQIQEEAEDMERTANMRDVTPPAMQLDIPDDIPGPQPDIAPATGNLDIPDDSADGVYDDEPSPDEDAEIDHVERAIEQATTLRAISAIEKNNASILVSLSAGGREQVIEALEAKKAELRKKGA